MVLDFLLDRSPFAQLATDLLAAAKTGQVELLVLSLTYITSHYDRPDFEDAVQFYAALAAGAEAIVTRDPKGFPTQQVPVLNPLVALAQL